MVLGDRERAERAAGETSGRGLWANAVELAKTWRLLPQLRTRVAELDVTLEAPVARSLAEAVSVGAAQSLLVCHRSAEALAALERAGVRAAAFKGIAMIAAIYGEPGKRMINDADVLIDAADVRAALGALRETGFEPNLTIDLDQWLVLLDERVYPLHDYLELDDGEGTTIDLHWRISTAARGGLAIGDVLGRAVRAQLFGKPVTIVAPEDSMLLTAYHAVRDRLAPQSAVKDFCDLRTWLVAGSGRWDLDATIARARSWGLANALLTGWRVLERLDPGCGAGESARRMAARLDPANRVTAERLTELFFLQLREGAVSPVMLGLTAMSPALLRRFAVSRMHSLTSATYDSLKFGHHPDTRLWPKLRRLAREICRLSPRRWAAYRALSREHRDFIAAEEARARDDRGS